MKWALILLATVSLIELLTWVPPIWRHRKKLAYVVIVLQSLLSGLVFGFSFNVWTALILIATVYRVINLLRLVEGRTESKYLYKVSKQTALRLVLAQLIFGLLWFASSRSRVHIKPSLYMSFLGALEFIVAITLVISLRRNVRTTRPKSLESHYASRDLPSISVLIPARNETVDLELCLSSLVASSYPKLEILVLDDCSQNKRTPEIIKSFAQAGVRFIAGELPPQSWLAKNYAYEQLSEQASGEILVFAGVDTRFSPDSLNFLIETMLEKKKIMASVMPINKAPDKFNVASCLLQSLRYAWELALPRRLVNRPPVLSTCWIISAKKLKSFGGFKAIARSNSPESYFARKAIHEKDGYSFIRATKEVGLTSEKTFNEQKATAVRTRYPQAHRRLEVVGLYTLAEVTAFLLPIYGLIWGLSKLSWIAFALGVTSLVWLSVAYSMVCTITYSKFIVRSLILWPLAALTDIVILNYSMWQYEFKEVLWKGRNVCLPIMRVPSIDQEQ